MPETIRPRNWTPPSKTAIFPAIVEVYPPSHREWRYDRDATPFPARETDVEVDPRSSLLAGTSGRNSESEATASMLRERKEAQARREEELSAAAEARERRELELELDENGDSPSTPGTPAIDIVTHLTNQAERIIAERGYQITLPYRFKHPQPDEVVPRQVVAADGTARELRDGEMVVLARREEGSQRAVKGKRVVRGDRGGGGGGGAGRVG